MGDVHSRHALAARWGAPRRKRRRGRAGCLPGAACLTVPCCHDRRTFCIKRKIKFKVILLLEKTKQKEKNRVLRTWAQERSHYVIWKVLRCCGNLIFLLHAGGQPPVCHCSGNQGNVSSGPSAHTTLPEPRNRARTSAGSRVGSCCVISDAFPVLLVVLRGSHKPSNTIPFCPPLFLLKLFSYDTCLSVSLHQSGHILRPDRDVNLGTESSIVCNVCLWFVSFFPFLETVPESGTGSSQRCCSGSILSKTTSSRPPYFSPRTSEMAGAIGGFSPGTPRILLVSNTMSGAWTCSTTASPWILLLLFKARARPSSSSMSRSSLELASAEVQRESAARHSPCVSPSPLSDERAGREDCAHWGQNRCPHAGGHHPSCLLSSTLLPG